MDFTPKRELIAACRQRLPCFRALSEVAMHNELQGSLMNLILTIETL